MDTARWVQWPKWVRRLQNLAMSRGKSSSFTFFFPVKLVGNPLRPVLGFIYLFFSNEKESSQKAANINSFTNSILRRLTNNSNFTGGLFDRLTEVSKPYPGFLHLFSIRFLFARLWRCNLVLCSWEVVRDNVFSCLIFPQKWVLFII